MENNKNLGISKTQYTLYRQCGKALWLLKNRPELAEIDYSAKSRMDIGVQVGKVARGLFGDYVDVTTHMDAQLDLASMVVYTKQCINNNTPVICEASFCLDDSKFCSVDILRKTPQGYAIYEVKSSTASDKDVYIEDVAYQKYILQNCGINITGCYLVHLNSEYALREELKLDELFSIDDISGFVENAIEHVGNELNNMETLLSETEEPNINISVHCHSPYDCAFRKYCFKEHNIPEKNTVFECYRMRFNKKIEHYNNDCITFEQLIEKKVKLNSKQLMQVKCSLENKEYIDTDGIHNFMKTLSYPLYFLDFETQNDAIPIYIGCHPYQQVPFQYSLHIAQTEDCTQFEHKEYLGISGVDSRRALAEQLVRDIPMNACSVAYNMAFERMVIKELADAFPDLAEHLLSIRDNMKDLLEPFQNGYYYVPAMHSSFSIKSVLPALFPNDPELNYHNLSGSVHNGVEAMTIYPQIQYMTEAEQKTARESLLRYCELDTWAMVKVWQKLKNI